MQHFNSYYFFLPNVLDNYSLFQQFYYIHKGYDRIKKKYIYIIVIDFIKIKFIAQDNNNTS